MISAGEFRNGVTFEQDGQVLQVVEFQHVKPGKGAAFVRTKTKNVITGSVVETSYNPTAKFPQAFFRAEIVLEQRAEGGREGESHGQAGSAHAVVILFSVRLAVHGNEGLLEHAGQGAAAYVPADEHEAHKHQGHGCHDDDCMFT